MNRFDASTIWNLAAEGSTGQEDSDPFQSNDQAEDKIEKFRAEAGETFAGQAGPDSAAQSSAMGAQTFFVPMHYESNYRYPLVVWLHSDGYNENQVCHVMPHVSTRNYLATGIRAPMAVDASGHRFAWSRGKSSLRFSQQYVLDAIDRTARKYSVHAERIVIAGYRDGGSMALRLAMHHPEMFAAAVSLGGGFELPGADEIDHQRVSNRRLPMLWQHSLKSESYDEDQIVTQAKDAVSICARLEIRQYQNDDEMNTAVLSDLDRWIMHHVVGGAPVAKISQWDTSPTSFSDN